ncbi:MAG: helix-turn-helix domain-containing protein [Dehalococcoidales bacterium]|nr:helix-turn-helix domain-containing protein [Dehalococcoidales bacterium]
MKVMDISFLTPEQVAGILYVNVLTVYSYIRKEKLGAIRLGRSYRIMTDDLQHFIELNRVNNRNVVMSLKEE